MSPRLSTASLCCCCTTPLPSHVASITRTAQRAFLPAAAAAAAGDAAAGRSRGSRASGARTVSASNEFPLQWRTLFANTPLSTAGRCDARTQRPMSSGQPHGTCYGLSEKIRAFEPRPINQVAPEKQCASTSCASLDASAKNLISAPSLFFPNEASLNRWLAREVVKHPKTLTRAAR